MRRLMHSLLIWLGVPFWALGVFAFGAILLFGKAADKVMPGSMRGNCWSFVLPRWYADGGYIAIRWAKGRVRFLGMRIPHAVWIKSLPEHAEVEHTMPMRRSESRLLPQVVYFPFTISRVDK